MLRIPCDESDTPDDWFIMKDGKQYASDDLLTEEQLALIHAAADEAAGDDNEVYTETYQRLLGLAEREAKRIALAARRHAKEACLTCPVRLQCLDMAMTNVETHGTWGGHYEEELREIRTEIARRKRARALRNVL